MQLWGMVPMKRGDVWWVNFEPSVGSEIRKIRPVVIVSNNSANTHLNRVQVIPLTSNTGKCYPSEAVVTIDVRHVERQQLDEIETIIRNHCAESRFGCELALQQLMALETTHFDPAMADTLRRAAQSLGLESIDMISGAFHDSVNLARHCPTAMLFVPSRSGISHNPDEHTDPELLVAGTRVLAKALAEHAGIT